MSSLRRIFSFDQMIRSLIKLSALVTFGALFFIVGYILIRGIPHLTLDMFALEYTTENVSMLPAIITTLMLVALTLVIATPIGVFTGFYLVEYAKKGNKFVDLIRITTETLSGSSIVYGLFGMLFFVYRLDSPTPLYRYSDSSYHGPTLDNPLH